MLTTRKNSKSSQKTCCLINPSKNWLNSSEFPHLTFELIPSKLILEFHLKNFSNRTYELLNKTVGEILRTLVSHFEKISKTITDLFKHLYDGFNERILPSLRESWAHIEQSLLNLYDEVINASYHLFERLVDILKKFEDDFKKIGKTAAEWFKKVSKALTEQLAIIQKEFEDLYKLAIDYIKALPGIDYIKEKYNEVSTYCLRFYLFSASIDCFLLSLYRFSTH